MPIFDHRHLRFTERMDWTLRQIRPAHEPIVSVFPFDLETFLIGPAQTAPKMVCMSSTILSFGQPPRAPWLQHANFDRNDLAQHIYLALLDNRALLTGANISFDLLVLANEFPELLPRIFDALDRDRIVCLELAQKLVDIATNQFNGYYGADGVWVKHEYNLAALVRRHLGVDLDKDTWRLRYGTLWDVPVGAWEQGAVDYSIGDTTTGGGVLIAQLDPWELRGKLNEPNGPGTGHIIGGLQEEALRTYFSTHERVGPELTLIDIFRQTRAQFWLALMVARGIRVDPVMVANLRALLERERDAVFGRLLEAGLVDKSGKRNTKAAAARMTAVWLMRGKRPPMTSGGDKGVPQVELSDESCTDSGDGLLADYASYTSLSTMLTKDIGALERPATLGLPVQSRFEPLQETGRTSCSGGGKKKKNAAPSTFSYQQQNPRRELGIVHLKKADPKIDEKIGVRQCFVARPGFVLSSNDFGKFEACSWCQASIDLGVPIVNMIRALNADEDVHLHLAAGWLGTSYLDVYQRYKAKDAEVKDVRQKCKPGTFGFMGGMGAITFVAYAKGEGTVFTLPEAKKLRGVWYDSWQPKPYFDFISRLVGPADMGEVIHVRSLRRRAWVPYTVASNSFFQGLAADCAKDAGYEIAREMYLGVDRQGRRSPLEGSRIVNFVHDEFISEHPIDIAHEASHRAAELMMEAGKRWMPDVPPKVEPALMRAWSKSADARFDANRRLIPWEPSA